MQVKTITVDLWGTLLFDRPSSDNRYKTRRLADIESLLAAAGVTVSTAGLDRAHNGRGTHLVRTWATPPAASGRPPAPCRSTTTSGRSWRRSIQACRSVSRRR